MLLMPSFFGHSKNIYRGKVRCPKCSSEHELEDYQEKEKAPICLHCYKNHLTTDRSCEEFTRQQRINELMARSGLSFIEAAQSLSRPG